MLNKEGLPSYIGGPDGTAMFELLGRLFNDCDVRVILCGGTGCQTDPNIYVITRKLPNGTVQRCELEAWGLMTLVEESEHLKRVYVERVMEMYERRAKNEYEPYEIEKTMGGYVFLSEVHKRISDAWREIKHEFDMKSRELLASIENSYSKKNQQEDIDG